MKKALFTLLAVVLFTATVAAQDRNSTVGLRVGYQSGISVVYQDNLTDNLFLEGNATYSWQMAGGQLDLTVDYTFLKAGNFNFYAGLGLAGLYYSYEGKSIWGIGGAGNLGVEYKFSGPFSLAITWKPEYYYLPEYKEGLANLANVGLSFHFWF